MKVKSSSGGTVKVEIKGVDRVLDKLRRKGQEVKQGADTGALLAANLIQQEVQESIIGNRAEPKSVDTGKFANSIMTIKLKDAEYKVYPMMISYPGTNTTTQDVALFMEYGTSTNQPRMHFRNSLARNKEQAINIIKKEIARKV